MFANEGTSTAPGDGESFLCYLFDELFIGSKGLGDPH